MTDAKPIPDSTITLARRIRSDLVGSGLPRNQARLYSQQSLISAGQPGLVSWSDAEAELLLQDAARLIEASFVLKEVGDPDWQLGLRRAAEIFEWLSFSGNYSHVVPERLLAAALYQLAGYPARSAGVLGIDGRERRDAKIIQSLLQGDFAGLQVALGDYWSEALPNDPTQTNDELDLAAEGALEQWLTDEIARAMGVLCAYVRWGDRDRLSTALSKLSAAAKVMLYGVDTWSWILAKIVAEFSSEVTRTSLREIAGPLAATMTSDGREALERYFRYSFTSRRSIAWPSQHRGVERLTREESFALCTPTGSGKTTVAELAILQGLFSGSYEADTDADTGLIPMPLALYLVPSRALAAEVESKLARVLRTVGQTPIVVTGLYGGTDWGPTDAWLASSDPTVLICTFEKAEALLRFLGPVFLARLTTVVIDEAHSVQLQDGDAWQLKVGENRALRLESLITRLLTYLPSDHTRVLALSAVTAGAEAAIAKWVSDDDQAEPTIVPYRSTRQLIGRLQCQPNRRFAIFYDLLDGQRLVVNEGETERSPYIPNPFPETPPAPAFDDTGPEKRLRPHLFWAALNIASSASRLSADRHGVLISVPQQIGGYAEDLLVLLERTWADVELPRIFDPPPEDSESFLLWQRSLSSCQDYFGVDSREYRLLQRGIVLHHGKMPGPMARLLVELVDRRVVHLALATSTLTEGVNLPFETVLLPSLRRSNQVLSPSEVLNLAGRAGRPGVATEGRTLILLDATASAPAGVAQIDWRYRQVLDGMLQMANAREAQRASSPLAALLEALEAAWQRASGLRHRQRFLDWLEQTAPGEISGSLQETRDDAADLLDSLDAILLSSLVELERLSFGHLELLNTEQRLRQVWARTYARYASNREKQLEETFVHRGLALESRIYPDVTTRRRIYRTSLPPRSALEMLEIYPDVRAIFEAGYDYARWEPQVRLEFIQSVIREFARLPRFAPNLRAGNRNVDWTAVLHWWLDPLHAEEIPDYRQVTEWHSYVSNNFVYRMNWAIGIVLALAVDDYQGEESLLPSFEDLQLTGLPWIALWMKELLTWGTLDPVAAFLLARGIVSTRPEAEAEAGAYYQGMEEGGDSNDELNPSTIQAWVRGRFSQTMHVAAPGLGELAATLVRDFSRSRAHSWRVLPVEGEQQLRWIDAGGFELARSSRPESWTKENALQFDFVLDSTSRMIRSAPFV